MASNVYNWNQGSNSSNMISEQENKSYTNPLQPGSLPKSSIMEDNIKASSPTSSNRTLSRSNKSAMSSSRSYQRSERNNFNHLLINDQLIDALLKELKQVTRVSNNFQVTWEAFINIKSILNKLEEEQKDVQYSETTIVDSEQYKKHFDKLIYTIHSTHDKELDLEELKKEAAEVYEIDEQLQKLSFNNISYQYPERVELFDLEPTFSFKYDRGVKLTSDLSKGSKIFQIPKHVMMTSIDASLDKDLVRLMDGMYDIFQSNSKLRLTMYLYLQKQKGLLSKYNNYFNCLPKQPNHPIYFNLKKLEPFKSSYIIADIMAQTIECARYYCNIYQHLQQKNYFEIKKFTWTAFKWCYTIVLSRSINLPLSTIPLGNFKRQCQEVALIPIADLFNFDINSNAPIFNLKTNCLELYANTNLYADQEVFIKYPILDNRELLLRYGFITSDILKFDNIRLPISIIKEDQYDLIRLKLSEYLNLAPHQNFKILRNDTLLNKKFIQSVTLASLNTFKLMEYKNKINNGKYNVQDVINKFECDINKLDQHQLSLITLFLQASFENHLNYSITADNLDDIISNMDVNKADSFPDYWILLIIQFERRFLLDFLEALNARLN